MRLIKAAVPYVIAWILLTCVTYTVADLVDEVCRMTGYELPWSAHKVVSPVIVALIFIFVVRYNVMINVYVTKRRLFK